CSVMPLPPAAEDAGGTIPAHPLGLASGRGARSRRWRPWSDNIAALPAALLSGTEQGAYSGGAVGFILREPPAVRPSAARGFHHLFCLLGDFLALVDRRANLPHRGGVPLFSGSIRRWHFDTELFAFPPNPLDIPVLLVLGVHRDAFSDLGDGG